MRNARLRTGERERARYHRAHVYARQTAARLASEFGVHRVVLIGSALAPERYTERSDIDLVVYGLAPGDYFRAVAGCMNADFDIDLIPFEQAHALVLDALARGDVLYEE